MQQKIIQIGNSHLFVDGNKRTGMVSGLVFLELIGLTLEVRQEEFIKTALDIATKKLDIKKTGDWIQNHTTKSL